MTKSIFLFSKGSVGMLSTIAPSMYLVPLIVTGFRKGGSAIPAWR